MERLVENIQGKQVVIANDVLFDPEKRAIVRGNKLHHLPLREFTLLLYFIENEGKIVTTEQILKDLWDEYADQNLVSQYVLKLRKKMGDRDKRIITTHPGVGYLFERKVHRKFSRNS